MLRFSLSSLVKFLIGILLVQGATVLLVITALKTSLEQTGLLFLLLLLSIGALTALWFTAIADGARKQALALAREGFSREREKIRVRAEQDKTREVRNVQRQVDRQARRARTGSNLKTGVIIGGAMSVGVVMLLTQFVTLGLLTLTTVGGAALGYGVRARQDRLGLGTGRLLGREEAARVIAVQPPTNAPEWSADEPKAIRGN